MWGSNNAVYLKKCNIRTWLSFETRCQAENIRMHWPPICYRRFFECFYQGSKIRDLHLGGFTQATFNRRKQLMKQLHPKNGGVLIVERSNNLSQDLVDFKAELTHRIWTLSIPMNLNIPSNHAGPLMVNEPSFKAGPWFPLCAMVSVFPGVDRYLQPPCHGGRGAPDSALCGQSATRWPAGSVGSHAERRGVERPDAHRMLGPLAALHLTASLETQQQRQVAEGVRCLGDFQGLTNETNGFKARKPTYVGRFFFCGNPQCGIDFGVAVRIDGHTLLTAVERSMAPKQNHCGTRWVDSHPTGLISPHSNSKCSRIWNITKTWLLVVIPQLACVMFNRGT